MTAKKSVRLPAARRTGGLLAIRMLEEIRDTPFENLTIEDDFRTRGTPQDDLVGRYLRRLRTPEMTDGFTALLTHFLAVQEHAGTPEPAYLELVATMPAGEVRAEWERKQARKRVKAVRSHLRSLTSKAARTVQEVTE